MNKTNRVVLLLAAYDFESLHLTLESLNHTLDYDENVVIVLNGKRGIRSSIVEEVAREWCQQSENRYVVKPLNYGLDAYNSISEVIHKFPLLQNVEFICKIDDDLIPVKKGWVDNLHQAYLKLEKQYREIGFVTSLINNNAWGFKRLIDIYKKKEEYEDIMNFESHSYDGIVNAKGIAEGRLGSVWQYPYLAKWVHTWTLYSIKDFIAKTADLGIEEIGLDTYYSIGCIFFRKSLWSSLPLLGSDSSFDELLIHEYCNKFNLRKFALMNEPMGHLFYYTQRIPNRLILPKIKASLANHWNDQRFNHDFHYDETTNLEIVLENHLFDNVNRLDTLGRELDLVKKDSFIYRLKKRYYGFRTTVTDALPINYKKKQVKSHVTKKGTLTTIKVSEKKLIKK
ncbi:MAG: hypothetical protein EOO46_07975 [Flavobacterium sp.]|nr:MAG: hypothetical protein EOO46_07975 [Flavobacterium sp.]